MRHIQTNVGQKNQLDIFLFDDMNTVLEYVDPNLFQPGSVSFVGERLPEWADVQKRVDHCWAEAAHIVEEFYQKLLQQEIPELASHVRRVQYNDFDGDELDYDRMLNSQAMWRKSQRESNKGNTEVTIFVDVSTPARCDPEDVFWRGGAAVALTKLLEDKGYKVELWITDGGQFLEDVCDNGPLCKTITAACLKRGQDTLNLTNICNSLGGWFYRTVVFTIMRSIGSKLKRTVMYSLGPARIPTQDQLDLISHDETRILIAGVYSFDAALACVTTELTKIQESH